MPYSNGKKVPYGNGAKKKKPTNHYMAGGSSLKPKKPKSTSGNMPRVISVVGVKERMDEKRRRKKTPGSKVRKTTR